ncbi:ABC transporter permease [Oceanobacillus sojae]|uniref:ABC transporter permease n=1 Tax=Oceanobacillus sojae TaxID=582851 RepID=UPI00098888E5|nr:ABC transporter permease [Oceanobacillus sojae]MCT1902417.1 ABC transporter permease [Oceanobacillus sojae]
MFSVINSEWYKLRKSKVLFLLLIAPLIGLFIGIANSSIEIEGINAWHGKLVMMNFTYAILFLPLISGVLASVICRYEHQEGGWKQLLALPVTRGKVFLSKYLLLILLMLVMQLMYLVSIYLVGMIEGITDPFPMDIVWKSIFGGWVATLPLIALQLWVSIAFKSFAAPFAINVIFTLPTILVINSERFGPYYPWGQPFLMMNIGGSTEDVFFVPWDQILMVVGGSFLLFFIGGYLYFLKKAI